MLHAIQIVWAHTAQNITSNGYLLRDSKHSLKILKQANVWEVIQHSFNFMERCLFCGDDCLVVRHKNTQIAGEKRTYVVLLTDMEIFRLKRQSSIMHSKEEMNGEEM